MKKDYFDQDSKILFKWDALANSYEPFLINCRVQNNQLQGEAIEKDSLLFDFLMYIKFASRQVDKRSGSVEYGYLEIYQYIIAIRILQSIQNAKSEDLLVAISRQAGKSYIVRKIIAFMFVFGAHHIPVSEDRFYMIYVSPTKDLASDQSEKMDRDITLALDFFNKKYHLNQLSQDRKNWSLTTKKLNRNLRGKDIPYSSMDVVWSSSKIVAGYTAHAVFTDESQGINAGFFNEQIKPFTTRTSGSIISIGTTLPSVENLLYDMFIDEAIPPERKIRYTWEQVYKYKNLLDEKTATKYATRVEKEITKYGKSSEYVQTQYYVSFDVVGTRFLTLDKLLQNGILTGLPGFSNLNRSGNHYVVAGFDPSLINDYAAMVIGDTYVNGGEVLTTVRDCIVFNQNKEKLSIDQLLYSVAEMCRVLEIDILMIDSTATDRSYMLYTILSSLGVGTMLVPYAYTNKTKQQLFTALEDGIFSQKIKLPLLEYTQTSWAYNELIEELLYFKKEVTSSGVIKYQAPQSANYYDDLVNALALCYYAVPYLEKLTPDSRTVSWGNIVHYMHLRKYLKLNGAGRQRAYSWM